jgi:hypothetical protein
VLFVFFSNKEALSIINVFIFRVDAWRAAQMAALNDRGTGRSLLCVVRPRDVKQCAAKITQHATGSLTCHPLIFGSSHLRCDHRPKPAYSY